MYVSVHIKEHFTDVCAVIILDTLFRNSYVKSYLLVQKGFDIVNICCHCKIPDMLHVKQSAVGQTFLTVIGNCLAL